MFANFSWRKLQTMKITYLQDSKSRFAAPSVQQRHRAPFQILSQSCGKAVPGTTKWCRGELTNITANLSEIYELGFLKNKSWKNHSKNKFANSDYILTEMFLLPEKPKWCKNGRRHIAICHLVDIFKWIKNLKKVCRRILKNALLNKKSSIFNRTKMCKIYFPMYVKVVEKSQ